MSGLLADLSAQWNALPARTRQLAVAGGVVAALLLLYTIAWSPLQKDLARLRTSVPRETEQLGWMRAQAPMAKALRARAVGTSGALIPTIEQSATGYGVRAFITKLETEGSAGARVTLEAVPFNSLVTWISELQAAHGLVIEEATVEAHATPGIVNARLRLRTGGT